MQHSSNIKSFILAANGQDPLLRAYCGLVALELTIKHEVGLSDHDVVHGLNKLRAVKAVDSKSWTAGGLLSMTNKLRTDLVAIHVNGVDGAARTAPANSYPYLRYCRFANDGWAAPHTAEIELATLANTVQQIRNFLRTNFSLPT